MRAVDPQDLEQDQGEASSILNFASLHVAKEDLPPHPVSQPHSASGSLLPGQREIESRCYSHEAVTHPREVTVTKRMHIHPPDGRTGVVDVSPILSFYPSRCALSQG